VTEHPKRATRNKWGHFAATPEDTRFMKVEEIAREIGLDYPKTRCLIARNFRILQPEVVRHGHRVYYNASIVELLKAMLGQPHRDLEGPDSDWLANYLKEKHAESAK
jgi:hypothetical protein